MNTSAKRGHVTPGDRCGVCRSRGVTTEGLWSGERRSGELGMPLLTMQEEGFTKGTS